MPMYRRMIVFTAALAFSLAAHAAMPSDASVDRLLEVMRAQQNFEGMLRNLEPMMHQGMAAAMQGRTPTPEQQRAMDNTAASFAKVMREEFSWEAMRALQAQIYRETFTQEEIDGLIAFYESPIGQAFVDKMPIAMQKSMSLMQARIGPMIARMTAAMRDAARSAVLPPGPR